VKQPPIEVADIFRAVGRDFIEKSRRWLTWQHLKVLRAIEHCRTAALGGHVDTCSQCGHRAISFNSCRNRHCPKCQVNARSKWVKLRADELLPVKYFHVVFTLPHELSGLALRNKRALYELLFRTCSETLDPAKYTVNHTQYLMVELPDSVALDSVRDGLRQLVKAHIVPVITHPARNISLQAKLDEVAAWNKDGCMMQVTAQSFLGRFGPLAKRAADQLMHKGLVHFVATDAHDCLDRPPNLSSAYRYISTRFGIDCADSIFIYNPACVVSGESLDCKATKTRTRSRFLAFWR
jgi:hypothetical protein